MTNDSKRTDCTLCFSHTLRDCKRTHTRTRNKKTTNSSSASGVRVFQTRVILRRRKTLKTTICRFRSSAPAQSPHTESNVCIYSSLTNVLNFKTLTAAWDQQRLKLTNIVNPLRSKKSEAWLRRVSERDRVMFVTLLLKSVPHFSQQRKRRL